MPFNMRESVYSMYVFREMEFRRVHQVRGMSAWNWCWKVTLTGR